ITATCWAAAGGGRAAAASPNARVAATVRRRLAAAWLVRGLMCVLVACMVAVARRFLCLHSVRLHRRYSPRRRWWQHYCSKMRHPAAAAKLLLAHASRSAQGPQAHRQHKGVVVLDVAAEGEIADVDEAQHVAVVDIADADAGLVELAGLDV